MGMSDCIKCWTTPCCCGYEYKDYSKEKFTEFVADILSYKEKDEQVEILKNALKKVIKAAEKDVVKNDKCKLNRKKETCSLYLNISGIGENCETCGQLK